MFINSGELVIKCRCIFKYKLITVNKDPKKRFLLTAALASQLFSAVAENADTILLL